MVCSKHGFDVKRRMVSYYVPDNYVALRFADQHVTIDGANMAAKHCISDATRFHKPSSNEVNSMPRTRGIPLVAVTPLLHPSGFFTKVYHTSVDFYILRGLVEDVSSSAFRRFDAIVHR